MQKKRLQKSTISSLEMHEILLITVLHKLVCLLLETLAGLKTKNISLNTEMCHLLSNNFTNK